MHYLDPKHYGTSVKVDNGAKPHTASRETPTATVAAIYERAVLAANTSHVRKAPNVYPVQIML